MYVSLFRLARIKADAKKKRDEREKAERLRSVELERRKTCLKKQFLEWNVGDEGKLELAMVSCAFNIHLPFFKIHVHAGFFNPFMPQVWPDHFGDTSVTKHIVKNIS